MMFSYKDMDSVYISPYDPVVITTYVRGFRERLLVDEGHGLTVLFNSYWERINLIPKLILEELNKVDGLDGHISRPIGQAILNMSLMN